MDSTDGDSAEIDPAIAEAMGFTSFGHQRPAKRMKFSDAPRPRSSGSGANKTALGVRKRPANVKTKNPDEVELELDDDDDDDDDAEEDVRGTREADDITGDTTTHADVDAGAGAYADTVTNANVDTNTDLAETTSTSTTTDPATSNPKQKQKPKIDPASGLAAYLARGQSIKPPASAAALDLEYGENGTAHTSATQSTYAQNKSGLSTHLEHSLPSRPGDSSFSSGDGPSHDPIPDHLEDLKHQDLQRLRRGVLNENGDIAYFLPTFLEDPWRGQAYT